MLKALRDTDSLVCTACKLEVKASGTTANLGEKRKRDREASGGAATEQMETIEEQKRLIESQSGKIKKMQEDIEELRKQLNDDAASVSSSSCEMSVSPTTGRVKSVQTNLGIITKMISKALQPLINDVTTLKQVVKQSVNFRDLSQPRIIRQVVNQPNTSQPSTSYAQVVRGGRGRQRSLSRNTNRQTNMTNANEETTTRDRRQIQPLRAFNPAVTLAQAFAAAPINKANRFTILSTAETEERNFAIINIQA